MGDAGAAPQPRPVFDPTRFRDTMAAHPSGVAVITTIDRRGTPRGMTATAVCSVSASPPLLLVCVDRESRTLPALLDRHAFIVNFMKSGRHLVCRRFASKTDDKFDGFAWSESPAGLPVLAQDAGAWLECEIEHCVDAGDHMVVIGRVMHGSGPGPDHEPIVYYRREFRSWTPA
jgi:flavin reductase (NADH)